MFYGGACLVGMLAFALVSSQGSSTARLIIILVYREKILDILVVKHVAQKNTLLKRTVHCPTCRKTGIKPFLIYSAIGTFSRRERTEEILSF